jgi:lipopolysaccharide/colanic/teichoic acid biosynthesis glycosyltransferase
MRILYIGNDPQIESSIQSIAQSVLIIDSPIRLLNLKTALRKIDFVVADKNQKGCHTSMLTQVLKENGLRDRIPVVVFGKDFSKEERKGLIKNGVSEIAKTPSQLEYTIKWFDQMRSELEVNEKSQQPIVQWTKRIFDVVFASLFLIIISPLLLLIVAAIRIDSKGPIVYKSKRVGQGYLIFDFLKFRTMKINADALVKDLQGENQYKNEMSLEERSSLHQSNETLIDALGNPIDEETFISRKRAEKNGTFFKIQNDPRITRVGRFLRSTSLDELPQFINVLKGEMSIIGNRPLPLYEAEQLTTDQWVARFKAPAGITGLWQVKKRGKAGMSETERKELDNIYAVKGSFLFDMKIMLQTIPALFQKENV